MLAFPSTGKRILSVELQGKGKEQDSVSSICCMAPVCPRRSRRSGRTNIPVSAPMLQPRAQVLQRRHGGVRQETLPLHAQLIIRLYAPHDLKKFKLRLGIHCAV